MAIFKCPKKIQVFPKIKTFAKQLKQEVIYYIGECLSNK